MSCHVMSCIVCMYVWAHVCVCVCVCVCMYVYMYLQGWRPCRRPQEGKETMEKTEGCEMWACVCV